jgi:hypothetical protein
MTSPGLELHDLLNAQAGRIGWDELARHFARGVVVWVAAGTDLLEIAESIVGDDADQISGLHAAGKLARARDEDAVRWSADKTEFWAVVVAPWVLVQEIDDHAA